MKKLLFTTLLSFLLVFSTVSLVEAHEILPEMLVEYIQSNPDLSPEELDEYIQEHDLDEQKLDNHSIDHDAGFIAFMSLGFFHILGGMDHVLFVLALMLGFSSISKLIRQVTAFTIGHSMTILLAGTGLLTLSSGFVEPLIAFSIAVVAYLAVFNKSKKSRYLETSIVIFFFGLFHGLGFAGVLEEIGQTSLQEFLISLVSFNVGIELGQFLILLLIYPIFTLFRKSRHFLVLQKVLAIVLIGLALIWTAERMSGIVILGF